MEVRRFICGNLFWKFTGLFIRFGVRWAQPEILETSNGKRSIRRVLDENDIAISAFKSLCAGAERGRLDHVGDRDDLWRLLATITARKVSGQVRHDTRQKRGEGRVRGHSVFEGSPSNPEGDGFDAIAGDEPTPEFLCQLAEEHRRLLQTLGDEVLVQIAEWKLEGWTGGEIADKLGLSRRSTERKLERIRECWKRELKA
ncbi:MAG TPA: RNA polymerase subunit sigma-70 [Verrucomicrobia bacterium]|nr:RNA polymerase subunit sigma-70 [Verrucomicrobiota bacterium]